MALKAPGIVPPGGTHLLIDLFGAKRLDDLQHVSIVCGQAADATGATILCGNFHHFGEGCGVSGVLLLAESHISFHGWHETGIATIDIYVCGSCDPTKAIPILKEGFEAERMTVISIPRGDEMMGNMIAAILPANVSPVRDEENGQKILKIFKHFMVTGKFHWDNDIAIHVSRKEILTIADLFLWSVDDIDNGVNYALAKGWIVINDENATLTKFGYGMMGGL